MIDKALDIAEKTLRFIDGRYEIGLPWKDPTKKTHLPDSYSTALRLLKYTEKTLMKNPDVWRKYDACDEDQGGQACDWFAELSQLTEIRFPRCLQLPQEIELSRLHAFCDASKHAFGEAAYNEHRHASGETSSQLVCSTANPANLLTRGTTVAELAENSAWWEGPDVIKDSESTCPS